MEHEKNEPRRRPPERNSRAAQAAQQRRDQRREQAHLEELRQKQRKRARHRTRRRINPGVWKRILIMAAVVAAVVLSMVLFFRVRSVEVTGSAYYTADEIRAACGEDVFILALCHRNDQLPLWAGLGVPVVLAGHAHGGIVRLPGLGGVFGTHYEFFPGDDAGLYVQDGTQLYVSRGLGPSRRLPIRVCNAPELPVLTLVRGEI